MYSNNPYRLFLKYTCTVVRTLYIRNHWCEPWPPLPLYFEKKDDKQTLDSKTPGCRASVPRVASTLWTAGSGDLSSWGTIVKEPSDPNGWLGIPWGFKPVGGGGGNCVLVFVFVLNIEIASGKWWQVMIVDRLWALIVVSIWGKSMLLTLKCKCSQVAVGDRRVLIVPIMVSWAKDVDSVQRWLCTLHRMFFFGNQKRVAKWLMVIFVPPIMHNYRLCTIKITKYDVLEANDIQVNDPQHGLEANT